jgi:hypothetical protein
MQTEKKIAGKTYCDCFGCCCDRGCFVYRIIAKYQKRRSSASGRGIGGRIGCTADS